MKDWLINRIAKKLKCTCGHAILSHKKAREGYENLTQREKILLMTDKGEVGYSLNFCSMMYCDECETAKVLAGCDKHE